MLYDKTDSRGIIKANFSAHILRASNKFALTIIVVVFSTIVIFCVLFGSRFSSIQTSIFSFRSLIKVGSLLFLLASEENEQKRKPEKLQFENFSLFFVFS